MMIAGEPFDGPEAGCSPTRPIAGSSLEDGMSCRCLRLLGLALLALTPRLAAQLPKPDPKPAEPPGSAIRPVEPCCGITTVDLKTGLVTAKENSTGYLFTFKLAVADVRVLRSLRPGQKVWADFATKKVSLKPAEPPGANVKPAEACCTIVTDRVRP